MQDDNKVITSAFLTDGMTIDQNKLFNHLKILSSDEFKGRRMGTDGNINARDYIVETLKFINVKPLSSVYTHDFINFSLLTNQQGSNVIGIVEGIKYPEQYIILSAHFDHLGQHGRKIFNGADDNSSGTAALLSLAEQLSKKALRYSVIFLFTDGEEINLLGAKAFAKDFPQLMSKTKLNINVDMIAGDKHTHTLRYISKNIESIIDNKNYNEFQLLQQNSSLNIKQGFRLTGRSNSIGGSRTNWNLASDHSIFYQANIPFIYFGVGEHINYHTVNDTFENVNLSFYHQATESIYQQILFLEQHM